MISEDSLTLSLAVAVPLVKSRIGDPSFDTHGSGVVWVQVFSYMIATPVALTTVGTESTVNVKSKKGGSSVSALLIACQ